MNLHKNLIMLVLTKIQFGILVLFLLLHSISAVQAQSTLPSKVQVQPSPESKKANTKTSHVAPSGMVFVEKGSYTPLYTKKKKKINVHSFYLDVYPVTNHDFLKFVKAQPRWKRSKVPSIFADRAYLRHWKSDTEFDHKKIGKSPVVRIAWFPAKYYCKWQGKRLPTVDEWEYAASASKTNRNGSSDPEYHARILQWYSRPSPKQLPSIGSTFKNFWGIYDMHGLIWEWTLDFQTALVSGESRGDSEINKALFCGGGSVGASDYKDYAAFMRYGFRSSLKAKYTTANLGFRCAKSLSKPIQVRKIK